MLRKHREFVKIYIDNIEKFSKTLNEHINHFIKTFDFFQHINIIIKLKNKQFKTYDREREVKKYIEAAFFDYAEVIKIVFIAHRLNAKLRFLLCTAIEFTANSKN